MLNIEKYRNEMVKTGLNIAKKKGKLYDCNDAICKDCDFYEGEGKICRKNILNWLISEYIEKPTLTEQEWHYCMSAKTGWVSRDKSGSVYVYDEKPKKHEITWGTRGSAYLIPYHLSFDFIRWEDDEPWTVEDLLKLEARKDVEV